ncbi:MULTISPECIES: hypothetical protein [unclassified Streptomyces]|uniref:hypothetical protein n=1 Tax=unclassified Streptomyces TaxID=2593676 RepID=UPI000F6D0780|nr:MULTISPECIES: hypothetical protein [unclassified Streptomyces]AZM58914.1 hypothetical protein DLM49_04460 [Streptomyces sp. WAC 01438]RSM93183.1 hypothetical protein DMA10_22060 [Streptomyces sp. WAC 01420]
MFATLVGDPVDELVGLVGLLVAVVVGELVRVVAEFVRVVLLGDELAARDLDMAEGAVVVIGQRPPGDSAAREEQGGDTGGYEESLARPGRP